MVLGDTRAYHVVQCSVLQPPRTCGGTDIVTYRAAERGSMGEGPRGPRGPDVVRYSAAITGRQEKEDDLDHSEPEGAREDHMLSLTALQTKGTHAVGEGAGAPRGMDDPDATPVNRSQG